jgi:hypothetical protein
MEHEERHTPPLAFFVGMFIFFVALSLSPFTSGKVRPVDSIRLFACGMGCGVTMIRFILALRDRRKP